MEQQGAVLKIEAYAARFPEDQELNETVIVAIQVADALDAAFARDVVHRDLKPTNISLSGFSVFLLAPTHLLDVSWRHDQKLNSYLQK